MRVPKEVLWRSFLNDQTVIEEQKPISRIPGKGHIVTLLAEGKEVTPTSQEMGKFGPKEPAPALSLHSAKGSGVLDARLHGGYMVRRLGRPYGRS